MATTISEKHEELLRNLYYGQSLLVGRDKLYRFVKENHPHDHPSRNSIMLWLEMQKIHQLHVRPPPKLPTKSVIVQKKLKYWQIDLTGPFPRDRGYNWIFGMIDVNSKYLYTAPLKNKTSKSVTHSLQSIILDNQLSISVIQTDGGGEFAGHEMEDLYTKYGIKHVISKAASPWSNGVIERVWGTLKQMLYKHQSINNCENWVRILPTLTMNYNQTYHRSIECTPIEALNLPPKVILKRLQDSSSFQRDEPAKQMKVGDTVRLRLCQLKLQKAKQYYSSDEYKVTKVINGSPTKLTTYKICKEGKQVLKGTYNHTDLLHVTKIQEPPIIQYNKDKPIRKIGIQKQAEIDALQQGRYLRPRRHTCQRI
jgi:hypothetical protein